MLCDVSYHTSIILRNRADKATLSLMPINPSLLPFLFKGLLTNKIRKQMVDIYLVVTENNLMMLKTDTKIKNVAKL